MKIPHIPVLLNEVLNSFKDLDRGYFIDCTLGYGGHSQEILKRHPDINHIGIDRDIEALNFSRNRLYQYNNRSILYKSKFSDILPFFKKYPIKGLLADFGVSSLQLDSLNRGFGFNSDILDMRMDRDEKITAKEIINNYSQDKLEYIFNHYGEIKAYKKLASAIIQARALKEIITAKELSKIAIDNLYRSGKIHPATLMFQAIRIEVNRELEEIESLLDILEEFTPSGAIISLITFHSLEDRLVKNRFKKWANRCICPPYAIRCKCSKDNNLGKIITKKPIIASQDEVQINPRSRSAKLRVFKFKD